MAWPSTLAGKIAAGAGLTAGAGAIGGLTAHLLHFSPAGVAVAVGAGLTAVAAAASAIIESIYRRRAMVVKARGAADVALVEALSAANALQARTEGRMQLERMLAEADADKAEQIKEVLWLRLIDLDVPNRLADETVTKLLASLAKNGAEKPGAGPASVVRAIRPPSPPAG